MTIPSLAFEDHEAMCRRCGISCHFAVPVNGLPVVVDDLHCRFLVREGEGDLGGLYRCSVYEERFERAPWCATASEALEDRLLAQDCPYTRFASGYRGKTRLHPRLLTQALPAIRRDVLENGVPFGVWEEGLLRFLERTGGGRWRLVPNATETRMSIEPADRD